MSAPSGAAIILPMQWVSRTSELLRGGLDLLLPPRCYACGDLLVEQGQLCAACWSDLTFISEPFCLHCGYPFDHPLPGHSLCARCQARPPAYRRARSLLVYDAASRRLVLALKRGDRTELARPLGRLMARHAADLVQAADLVVPVPLHKSRLFSRRFNQSALLARTIAKAGARRWAPTRLVRHRRTRSQGGLNHRQRQENVRRAFSLRGGVAGCSILLVDDVFTTGATVEACTRTLLAGGARAVDVLTLARVATPGRIPI